MFSLLVWYVLFTFGILEVFFLLSVNIETKKYDLELPLTQDASRHQHVYYLGRNSNLNLHLPLSQGRG